MDAASNVPWWIVECDGKRLPVTAPHLDLAGIYATATYQRETGRWPKTVTTPRAATRQEIETWAQIVADVKRRADTDPNYTPASLTDSTLAYLPYALDLHDTPSLTAPDWRRPPSRLIEPTRVRYVAGNLLRLWLWCIVAIAPLIVSAVYWLGHNLGWWTAFGWDRELGWFTNRSVMVTYILYGLLPVQSFWFIGWILSTDQWVNDHITTRPYFGGGIGGGKGITPPTYHHPQAIHSGDLTR